MKTKNFQHEITDHDFGKLAKKEKARARTRLYILHQYSLKKTEAEIVRKLFVYRDKKKIAT